MKKSTVNNATLELGDGVVVLRRDNQSTPIVANILGVDKQGEEVKAVWLDRIIHEASDKFEGWHAHGAFVTSFTRM